MRTNVNLMKKKIFDDEGRSLVDVDFLRSSLFYNVE